MKGNTTYSYVYTLAINPILDVEEECVYPSVVLPGGWVKVTPVDEIKISIYIGEKERRGD